jgi:hypothetical protein
MRCSNCYKQIVHSYLGVHQAAAVFVLLHTKRRDGCEENLFSGFRDALLCAECGQIYIHSARDKRKRRFF